MLGWLYLEGMGVVGEEGIGSVDLAKHIQTQEGTFDQKLWKPEITHKYCGRKCQC